MKEKHLHGKTVAVVGAGSSGRAAACLLCALGANTRILERKETNISSDYAARAQERGIELVFGDHKPEHFADVDMVVMSPGVPVAKITPCLPKERHVEVIGEMELASRYVAKPMLAITGTNGKTTTCTLAAHMLECAGKKVFLGGNIGTPLSEYVLQEEDVDVLVLEVSSFQLQTCTTFKPWVAVLLNVSPNHLDYHEDIEEYYSAKYKVFTHQDDDCLAIFPKAMQAEIETENISKARSIYFASKKRFVSDALPGAHNQENMEAAYQACRFFGVTESEAQKAISCFTGLPHRLAKVGNVNGIDFVDDSKATTVDALRVALESITKPVYLLAGGVFKGGDLKSLKPLLKKKVKRVGLFGESKDIFKSAWNGDLPVNWSPTMEEALKALYEHAHEGEVVLLSPATSSFDQYPNYKARGKDFQRIVGELK